MSLGVDLRSTPTDMTNCGSVEELWAIHLNAMAIYGSNG